MSSKGSQRCISIRADVDDASSGLPELDQAQAHAVAVNQDSNMPASKDSCGVVYDAVMELHMREGEGSCCCLLVVLTVSTSQFTTHQGFLLLRFSLHDRLH
jgi:hypothetical protein